MLRIEFFQKLSTKPENETPSSVCVLRRSYQRLLRLLLLRRKRTVARPELGAWADEAHRVARILLYFRHNLL